MHQSATGLKHDLLERLHPVFGTEPTFISDSAQVVEWLQGLGFTAYGLDPKTIPAIPKAARLNVVLIPCDDISFAYGTLNHFFRGSRLLIIPAVAFDPSFPAVKYTMELLSESDFESGAEQNIAWLKRLENASAPLEFDGDNGSLTCELRERLIMMKPQLKARLNRGEWEAIGSFFEIALVPDNEDFFHPGYIVNGRLIVEGIAIARHRVMPEEIVPLAQEAWDELTRLQDETGSKIELEIVDSKVVRAAVGNVDVTEKLLRWSNPKRELVLVEMAISNNPGLERARLDWAYNSVLNEGSRGIHVAVGDGVTGAHIDFCCPGVELVS